MAIKNPRVTTDGVVLKDNCILLVKRRNEPFKGKWALPGGFVDYGETTEEAVLRELFEETGLQTRILRLAGVYSHPDRDPRGHTITIVYQLEMVSGHTTAGDDAAEVAFFSLDKLPELSFDHANIIKDVTGG